jgi:hypothetical protein
MPHQWLSGLPGQNLIDRREATLKCLRLDGLAGRLLPSRSWTKKQRAFKFLAPVLEEDSDGANCPRKLRKGSFKPGAKKKKTSPILNSAMQTTEPSIQMAALPWSCIASTLSTSIKKLGYRNDWLGERLRRAENTRPSYNNEDVADQRHQIADEAGQLELQWMETWPERKAAVFQRMQDLPRLRLQVEVVEEPECARWIPRRIFLQFSAIIYVLAKDNQPRSPRKEAIYLAMPVPRTQNASWTCLRLKGTAVWMFDNPASCRNCMGKTCLKHAAGRRSHCKGLARSALSLLQEQDRCARRQGVLQALYTSGRTVLPTLLRSSRY